MKTEKKANDLLAAAYQSGGCNDLAGAPLLIHPLKKLSANGDVSLFTNTRLLSTEIFWVLNGNGKLKVDMQTHQLQNNCMYVLQSGQMRDFTGNADINGFYFSLTPDFFRSISAKVEIPEIYPGSENNIHIINVTNDVRDELRCIANMIVHELQSANNLKQEMLEGLVSVFLMHVFREVQRTETMMDNRKNRDLARTFIAMVKKDFISKKMVADYAGDLFVTPNYLNKLVKKTTGYPASHHIQQQIILEAKRRVSSSKANLKQIADQLGFDNYAHFSKFFKTNSGMNFSAYKETGNA